MKKPITLLFLLPLIAISGCSTNYFKDNKPTKCKGIAEVDTEFALKGSPIEIVTVRSTKNEDIPENWYVLDRIFIKDLKTGKVTSRHGKTRYVTGTHAIHFEEKTNPIMKLLFKTNINNYTKYIDLKECKITSR